ncbi:MAG: hypothetical protein ACR2JW_07985 [Thermomicrobiales bacterium]
MSKPLSRRAVVKAAAGVAATTLPLSFTVRGEAAEAVAPASEPFTPLVPWKDGKPLSGDALARWEATQRMPGIAYVEVSLFADGDPNYAVKGPDGTIWPGGETLAEWRAKYGGDIGAITHYATGQKFSIDLSPYAHLDPHQTRVRVMTGRVRATVKGQEEQPSGPLPPSEPIDPRLIIRISHIHPDDIRNPTGVKPQLTAGLATGTVRLQVSALHRDERSGFVNEQRWAKGSPLEEYRAALGGVEGEIYDPFYGQPYHLSLVPYANADPKTTHLRVQFIFTPDGHEEARRQAH